MEISTIRQSLEQRQAACIVIDIFTRCFPAKSVDAAGQVVNEKLLP